MPRPALVAIAVLAAQLVVSPARGDEAPAPLACTGQSTRLRLEDCVAWASFYDATAGAKWLACSDTRTDPCSCGHGPSASSSAVLPPRAVANITCSLAEPFPGVPFPENETLAISDVGLSGLGLTGDIGAAMAALSKLGGLRKLDLADNQLAGALPDKVLNTDVSYLDLGANALTGGIPPKLGELTDLKFLNLSRCGLSGSIPDAMHGVTDIVTLDLSHNKFSGPIPSGMVLPFPGASHPVNSWASACTWMLDLDLSHNEFTGAIPLFTCDKARDFCDGCRVWQMRTMRLDNNRFNGTIPDYLGEVGSDITELYLQANELSGAVPASLAQSPLTALRLDGNKLSGALPALPFQSYKECCNLDGNAFACPLPKHADACKQGPPTCKVL